MSPPRQAVLLWEIPYTQELPQATQKRCSELLTHLLLAAVNTASTNTEEERDEREDPTESH
jgi:DNA-binding protein YbaB